MLKHTDGWFQKTKVLPELSDSICFQGSIIQYKWKIIVQDKDQDLFIASIIEREYPPDKAQDKAYDEVYLHGGKPGTDQFRY
jgi:hypothetical protein